MTKRVRKTIIMPAKDLKNVLAALRAPENASRQGEGALFDGKGYCCLGLMQCVKTGGKVETDGYEDADNIFAALPSMGWLKKVGWSFKSEQGRKTSDPYLPTLKLGAAAANDSGDYKFTDIADAIEACTKTY